MIPEDPAEWQQTPEDNAVDNWIVAAVCALGFILYLLSAWT
jgi:hypothetical protein